MCRTEPRTFCSTIQPEVHASNLNRLVDWWWWLVLFQPLISSSAHCELLSSWISSSLERCECWRWGQTGAVTGTYQNETSLFQSRNKINSHLLNLTCGTAVLCNYRVGTAFLTHLHKNSRHWWATNMQPVISCISCLTEVIDCLHQSDRLSFKLVSRSETLFWYLWIHIHPNFPPPWFSWVSCTEYCFVVFEPNEKIKQIKKCLNCSTALMLAWI